MKRHQEKSSRFKPLQAASRQDMPGGFPRISRLWAQMRLNLRPTTTPPGKEIWRAAVLSCWSTSLGRFCGRLGTVLSWDVLVGTFLQGPSALSLKAYSGWYVFWDVYAPGIPAQRKTFPPGVFVLLLVLVLVLVLESHAAPPPVATVRLPAPPHSTIPPRSLSKLRRHHLCSNIVAAMGNSSNEGKTCSGMHSSTPR